MYGNAWLFGSAFVLFREAGAKLGCLSSHIALIAPAMPTTRYTMLRCPGWFKKIVNSEMA